MIGDTGIYDRTGKQGVLKSGPKPKEDAKHLKISKGYVQIDDEPTWLPAIITFQVVEMKGKQGLKGLSPQPDPPGKK